MLWAYKLRIIIIFINLKSNIRVGTCLCTYVVAFEYFVLSGLIQIQKRIQNNLKMLWNIWKGKRKGVLFLFSAFGPAAHPSPMARLPPNRARPSLLLRFPALGRAQRVQPLAQQAHASARAACLLCVSLMPRAHTSGPSSSPCRIRFLSLLLPIESASKSSSFLIWSAFRLYRSHAEPNRTHLILVSVVVVLESSVATSRSPSRRHSEPRVSFGPSSALFSREVSSSCSALPPRVFLSLNRAQESGNARSSHGVIVFAHRRRFFPAVTANSNRGPYDLGLTVQIRSYRFVAILLKSPSIFLKTNPRSMAYSQIMFSFS
jgi:hypothetical protein